MKIIIDATDLRVGRMATQLTKKLLLGDEVVIVNCEKAIITGRKDTVIAKYKGQQDRGRPTKGPFQPRMPDRFVRRIMRSMLPSNTKRGMIAFRNCMCHIGNPGNLETTQITEAHIDNSNAITYTTVGAICKELGGKWS